MIFYFTGLGNTAFVAKKISEALNDRLSYIPTADPQTQKADGESIGFFFPIYSWGLPVNVLDFIKNLNDSFFQEIRSKNLPVYMVCTYGDETGNAPEMLEKILNKRGCELKGVWGVQMPNTYVLLPGFDVDSSDVAERKLKRSLVEIDKIVNKIKEKKWGWDVHKGSFPSLRTKLIYPLFKKWGINPTKWHFSSSCVRCGKCVKVCPTRNITLREDGPHWSNNCISCLACFHNCPYHAVEYRSITKKKGQYVCPLK